jgi:phosphoglycerol transferase MdoB-like AlkP superfamily enzyme
MGHATIVAAWRSALSFFANWQTGKLEVIIVRKHRINLREPALLLFTAWFCLGIVQVSIKGKIDLPFYGLKFGVLATNTALLLTPLLLVSIFIRTSRLIGLSLLGTSLFALVNRLKIANLNEPVLIYDFYKLQSSSLLISYLGRYRLVGTALAAGIAALLIAWRAGRSPRAVSRLPLRRELPRLLAAFALSVFSALLVLEGLGRVSLFGPVFSYRPYAQLAMAADYGYFLSEALNLKFLSVHAPSRYGKDSIGKILAELRPKSAAPASGPVRRPNVVVILLESFRDFYVPEYHDAVHFNSDFIPFYHRLKHEAVTRTFISPVFGGGTANAEFEVLTGMNMDFLPSGSVPYAQYIRHPVPSVVGLFDRHGYRTVAIHGNTRTFWSRDQVYKHIGFQDFIASEELRAANGEAGAPGDFLDDRETFDKSIEMLRADSQPAPQFQLLITLGTHGPYDGPAKGTWYTDPARPGDAAAINVYGDKMRHLDENLARYFAALKQLKAPPTVILFGDHQPAVAMQLPGQHDPKSLHVIEAVFWNWRSQPLPASPELDLACLSPDVLSAGGIAHSPFFRFLDGFCGDRTVIHANELATTSEAKDPEVKEYQLLCFDRLFGEKFSVRARTSATSPLN